MKRKDLIKKLTLKDLKKYKGRYYFPDDSEYEFKSRNSYTKEDALDILYINNWAGLLFPTAIVTASIFAKVIRQLEECRK